MQINGIIFIGTLLLTILLGIIYYLLIILETYSSLGTIKNIINRGQYQVEIIKPNNKQNEIIIVKAWNTINAVEKAIKKLDNIENVKFKSSKL